MANVSKAAKAQLLTEHNYNLTALREACEEEEIEEMEEENQKMSHDHTPLPSPNPKKIKPRNQDVGKQPGKITNETILDAIQTLIKRFDEQDDESFRKSNRS